MCALLRVFPLVPPVYMAEQTADPLNNVLLLIMGHDLMVCDDELNGVSFGRELPVILILT